MGWFWSDHSGAQNGGRSCPRDESATQNGNATGQAPKTLMSPPVGATMPCSEYMLTITQSLGVRCTKRALQL